MSNEDTPVVDTSDDLDAFSSTFFGQKTDTPEPASSEEAEAPDTELDAPEEDTHSEDDTLADEDDLDDDQTPEPEAEVKPKKNRFQERIDELTAGKREAERRLADLEAKFNKPPEPAPAPVVAKVEEGPLPDDVTADGTEKYPLGEFDPQYIRDLTRHTLHTEREAMKIQEQAEVQKQTLETERTALQSDWQEKLGPAQERYPDFQEKSADLIGSFGGIEPKYGEYLTTAIMSMDYGTDVLYYLASNPAEARAIVNSGATKATIALGRIESKFAVADAEKVIARPKVSNAPTPPARINKGSAVSKPTVDGDTDDLEAFSSEFFKKRGR